MKESILNFWNWLVRSSADPAKLSLTLKSGGKALAIFALWFGYGADVSDEMIGDTATSIANFLAAVVLAFEAGRTAYGFCRKVYLTVVRKTA